MSIFIKQTKADEQKANEAFDEEPAHASSRSPLPDDMPAPRRDKRQKSVVQSDLFITGKLSTTGILEFCGHITGDISADTLFITEDGQISGHVNTKHLTTCGILNGSLTAEDVTIKSKSNTKAEIQCERISVESGAVIHGSIQCQPKRNS